MSSLLVLYHATRPSMLLDMATATAFTGHDPSPFTTTLTVSICCKDSLLGFVQLLALLGPPLLLVSFCPCHSPLITFLSTH